MVMHLKKEFNCIQLNTVDLAKEVKREFYKKFSSDSIEDLKRKKRPFHFGAFFFE
jgi:hypothetical protein